MSNNATPKSLKASTAKRYTVKQLYKHLDRVLTKLDSTLFRIDFAYDQVYIWSSLEGTYKQWAPIHEYCRMHAYGALATAYRQHGINHDFTYDMLYTD